jgi:2,3-dihydroxy-p-cumate/2,3-dihydroxybenzoate 3,4-dioxygenase
MKLSTRSTLHVEGPDGLILSYVNGMAEVGDKPRVARQFPLAATSLCNWAAKARACPN